MMKGRQTPRQQNRPRETGGTGGIGDASMLQTAEKGGKGIRSCFDPGRLVVWFPAIRRAKLKCIKYLHG
jgi:hypothetical protein